MRRYIPNILTISRIPLAILCCYYAADLSPKSLFISMLFFMAASFTDYLDGYYARRWNYVSTFGKFTDPVADKLLILGVLLVFAFKGVIPMFLAWIIVARELIVTIIRMMLMFKKVVTSSRYSGKIKTFSQVIVLWLIYNFLIYRKLLENHIDPIWINRIIAMMCVYIVIITIYSGIEVLWLDRKKVKDLI